MEQYFTTSSAFSVQVGKPSIHPVNVPIMTNRYYTLEKLASGWSPSAIPLPGRSHVIGLAGQAEVFELLKGFFNWQVGHCLRVIWRPVFLKDLSSNLWKAFSPKWVVACKELTNIHWKFSGRRRSPSLWDPIWSSWKPSLIALRVSPSVYEGVFGKLVCGTQVAAPITSLFCNAAL